MVSNHTSKLIFFILVCYITIYSFYSELQRVKITFSLSRLERNYCIWRQLLVSRIERSAFSLSSFGGLFSLEKLARTQSKSLKQPY